MISEGEGDEAMEEGDMADAMEEAGESDEDQALEDAGMEADKEMGQPEMEGDLSEEDDLARMKREYFKPKAPKMEPKKGVAKIMVAPPKITMAESIVTPSKRKGKMA